MSGDAFAEFECAGWERAAPRYEECWTDTALFVEALLATIAYRLNRDGIPSGQGGREWWASTVRAVLRSQSLTRPQARPRAR